MKYSEEAAFAKLAAQCSTAEYCTNDIEKRMRRWEMDETSIKKIIQRLLDEHFIDNTRYCRAFIKDKILFNRWGRRKIEEALYAKHISKDVSTPIFEELDKDSYLDTLHNLLIARSRTIKAKDDYDMRNKLIRYALQRGFSMGDILSVIDD
ncbi:MAG: RecX family transcriptional regulator [Bacteroidaceae bacterium]|nr:RecX family transcriptional regulator [Bacteroidaceae bacterium]